MSSLFHSVVFCFFCIALVVLLFSCSVYSFQLFCVLFLIFLFNLNLYQSLFDLFMLILHFIPIGVHLLFSSSLFYSVIFSFVFRCGFILNKHVKTHQNVDLTCFLTTPERCLFHCRITFWGPLRGSWVMCIQKAC